MAVSTVEFFIGPSDGWVNVAINPAALLIKPDDFHPWWVFVTPNSTPPSTANGAVQGVQMGRGNDARRESFQSGSIVGYVWIRTRSVTAEGGFTTEQKTRFGVIRDQ